MDVTLPDVAHGGYCTIKRVTCALFAFAFLALWDLISVPVQRLVRAARPETTQTAVGSLIAYDRDRDNDPNDAVMNSLTASMHAKELLTIYTERGENATARHLGACWNRLGHMAHVSERASLLKQDALAPLRDGATQRLLEVDGRSMSNIAHALAKLHVPHD